MDDTDFFLFGYGDAKKSFVRSIKRVREIEEGPEKKKERSEIGRGSVPGRTTIFTRDRMVGYHRPFSDYFAENPVYPPRLYKLL